MRRLEVGDQLEESRSRAGSHRCRACLGEDGEPDLAGTASADGALAVPPSGLLHVHGMPVRALTAHSCPATGQRVSGTVNAHA